MTTTSSLCGQGDFPAWCMCRRRLQSRERQRRKETPAQKVSCQPPRNLCAGIHLGWEMPAHQEEPWVRWRMCVAVFSYSFLKSVLSNGNSLKKICHRILRPIKKCLIKKQKNKFQTLSSPVCSPTLTLFLINAVSIPQTWSLCWILSWKETRADILLGYLGQELGNILF